MENHRCPRASASCRGVGSPSQGRSSPSVAREGHEFPPTAPLDLDGPRWSGGRRCPQQRGACPSCLIRVSLMRQPLPAPPGASQGPIPRYPRPQPHLDVFAETMTFSTRSCTMRCCSAGKSGPKSGPAASWRPPPAPRLGPGRVRPPALPRGPIFPAPAIDHAIAPAPPPRARRPAGAEAGSARVLLVLPSR